MCACILHNLSIDHAIPQDWMVNSNNLEQDEEEELDHHNETANQCNLILAYIPQIMLNH